MVDVEREKDVVLRMVMGDQTRIEDPMGLSLERNQISATLTEIRLEAFTTSILEDKINDIDDDIDEESSHDGVSEAL